MPAAAFWAAGTSLLEIPSESRYGTGSGTAAAAFDMEVVRDFGEMLGRSVIIERPRLTRLLDESTSRIIMLVAPAGYGKTTLARQWFASRRHGWYRGTTAAADVAALAVGLATTAATIVPNAGERMRERLRATGTPEQDVQPLAELLAEDLAQWPDDAWLAVDDYHFAGESEASERFVELLTGLAPVRLFVTSRTRPAWATTRRVLYGEIYELGRNLLAMSQDEAIEVLAHRTGAEASGLASLAEGWPAVIGLAALAGDFELPEGTIPDALHDYFAEELYQAADPETRWDLCRLGLAPSITAELAESLLGGRAQDVVREGLRLGFLTSHARGSFDVHPLLRTFLETKLNERPPGTVADDVHQLVHFLVEREQWDDAFSLLERFFDERLFLGLLEVGLSALLREARLPTLMRWLECAEHHDIDSPLVVLAEAELAFRKGHRSEAETLALESARKFGDSHPLASHSLFLAGASAHLRDQSEEALDHHMRAYELAQDNSSCRDALWGQLLAATKLELDTADRILQELIDAGDRTPEGELRIVMGRFMTGSRMGTLTGLVAAFESTIHLLKRVRDPMARTSFLNGYAQVLAASGRYSEALTVCSRTLEDASRSRLAFVRLYAQLVSAVAHTGMRNFARASALLDGVRESALAVGDRYLAAEASIRKARVLLAQRLPDRAIETLSLVGLPTTRGERGEHLATHALAAACMDHADDALQLSEHALEITRSPQVRVIAPCVRAIVALSAGARDAQNAACVAFESVSTFGDIDCFVCAYRAYPPLLSAAAHERNVCNQLGLIVKNARDRQLAEKAGVDPTVSVSQEGSPSGLLSRREREVLELLAQGLSNKEIGKLLFITEGTVKVHVRHIFEKLGVRGRTEAALRAAVNDSL